MELLLFKIMIIRFLTHNLLNYLVPINEDYATTTNNVLTLKVK